MKRNMITKKYNQRVKKFRALAILFVGGIALALLMESLVPERERTTSISGHSDRESREEPRATNNVYTNLALEARAAFVYDLQTDTVLYSKNENEPLPLASISKIMTALVARENMSESVAIITQVDDLAGEGDSGLYSGERWRLGELLDVMLLVSSNDAARTVARFVGANGRVEEGIVSRGKFVSMMNAKANTLGLVSMKFFNESGLDPIQGGTGDTPLVGGYGSARDVALLLQQLWEKYPETIEVTAKKHARIFSQDNLAHILPNTNQIVGEIPGLIASKTGYTDLSGGNLAIIYDKGVGQPVIIVVLGSTREGRFDDMKKLVTVTK